ncbi:hypothetical protein BMW23_0380 [Bodo saltans virus]|uniref:Uncharacterized protein n=1 Tax=Bodo saltans virus TaxID=2024608 RepID=A0A2H4UU88_9VIRU|nr:hypothetical protein QJ851_gp0371 [Bodo saltans virus]ATZ80434.1 hypothetical protein BMW23_0380 [Bodo saltans virus]
MSRKHTIENMSSKSRSAYKVSTKNFDIKRVQFDRHLVEKKQNKTDQKESKQYTFFPRYMYPELQNSDDDSKKVNSGESLAFQTEIPIEFKRGGIPKFDPEYHENECKTCFFWVPTDEEFGGTGGAEFGDAVSKLDNKYGTEIKENPDEYLFVKNGKDENPIEDLKYIQIVRESPKPAKVAKKDFRPWRRCKVNIPYKEDPKTHEPIINVKVAFPNEETGKMDSIIATSLKQLSEFFRFGCKARLIIDVKTFWVLKASGNCGFKLTCENILITEMSKSFAPKEHTFDDFFGGNEEDTKKADSDDDKPAKKSSKKVDSDDDDNDNKSTKKSSKKVESDDDDDDEKPAKKSSKKVESDDDDDDEKPAKKSSKKVESDDDDDKPAKKPAGKASKSKSK